MVVVLLEFASGPKLIVEGLPLLLKVLKRVARKRVKPIRGDPLETGGEHPAHEKVVVRINRYLILVVPKMLDGVGRTGVEVEARHYELP